MSLHTELTHACMCRTTDLIDGFIDSLHGGIVCNSVSNPNGHPMLQQPVVGQVLALAEEGTGRFGAMFHHDHVDEGAARGSQSLLAQPSSQQLAVLDQHLSKPAHLYSMTMYLWHSACTY